MHRIVLTGVDGMLGRAWERLLQTRGLGFDALRASWFDIRDPSAIDSEIRRGREVVINCAAFTDVDGAEHREEEALRVNGTAVGELARRCAEVGALLVHYSTDYVFDGRATQPYSADSPRDPVNAYGRTKAWGEQLLEASGCPHLLVRTSWLYAPWGKNFVRTMAGLAAERPRLRVVDDQRGRPTSAEHLARTTLALLEAGKTGTYHVCDGGDCTWFELAREVARAVRPECVVEPCSSEEFVRPARRPAYSVLDLSGTEAVLGPMQHWREAVRSVVERLP
ncbi:MAG: dTDP-4-dehydrorhamnose reductase [Myxococcota bacterium]